MRVQTFIIFFFLLAHLAPRAHAIFAQQQALAFTTNAVLDVLLHINILFSTFFGN
jgi:hypothetical protein